MHFLPLLAVAAGVAISLQIALNARLGVLLQSTLLGTSIAFLVGCVLCLILATITGQLNIKITTIQSVPLHLWFSGGALGALGVGLLYFLIPYIGVGAMTAFSLAGQLIIATTASHFGWFDLPQSTLTLQKLIGLGTLLIGVALINGKPLYAY